MSKASTQTVVVTPEQLIELQKQVMSACSSAEDSLETVHWHFVQLGNLFDSIMCLIGDKDSRLSKLAETGSYLANDWAGFVDCSRDNLSEGRAGIRALIQSLGVKP